MVHAPGQRLWGQPEENGFQQNQEAHEHLPSGEQCETLISFLLDRSEFSQSQHTLCNYWEIVCICVCMCMYVCMCVYVCVCVCVVCVCMCV